VLVEADSRGLRIFGDPTRVVEFAQGTAELRVGSEKPPILSQRSR
jgi:hypothetical protein